MLLTSTEVDVICAPEKSMASRPDFLIYATKGEVVALAMTLDILPIWLMTDFSMSVMLGDLSRNQLIDAVLP